MSLQTIPSQNPFPPLVKFTSKVPAPNQEDYKLNEYLQKSVWMEIFSKCSFKEVFKFGAVSKSWHACALETINTLNEKCARIVFNHFNSTFLKYDKKDEPTNWSQVLNEQTKDFGMYAEKMRMYHEQAYFKYRKKEFQGEFVNWRKCFEDEVAIDNRLRQGKFHPSSEKSIDFRFPFALDFQDDIIMMDKFLVMVCLKNAHDSDFLYLEDYCLLFSSKEESIRTPNKIINSIFKLTEEKFALVLVEKDGVSIEIYTLSQCLPEKIKRNEHKFNVEFIFPPNFFKEVMILSSISEKAGEWKLGVYLIYLGQLNVIQLEFSLRCKEFHIEDFQGDYLIVSTKNKAKRMTLVQNIHSHSILRFTHQFLKRHENIILFFDEKNEQILSFNLENREDPLLPLFNLSEVLSTYMSLNRYLVIGENQLHIYLVKQRETYSFDLLDQESEEVFDAAFIRVTDNLLFLSLLINQEKEDAPYNQVRTYEFDSTQNRLTRIEKTKKEKDKYFYFNDTYLTSTKPVDENNSDFQNPRQVKTVAFGKPEDKGHFYVTDVITVKQEIEDQEETISDEESPVKKQKTE